MKDYNKELGILAKIQEEVRYQAYHAERHERLAERRVWPISTYHRFMAGYHRIIGRAMVNDDDN